MDCSRSPGLLEEEYEKITAILCAIIMCAAIVCPFAFTAFAESTAYEIDALNMSIPIPDDMIVLTRESTANDEFFKTFKLNYDTTISKLTEGNIYLESVTEDSALTLTVTMTKTEDSKKIGSYNSLSDEELANIMQKLRENKTYKDASPVEYNDIKYICLNMSFKNGKKIVQAQQYNTVMNGENINITMQAAPGKKLKAADKEMLAEIVSGVTILNDNFFNRNKQLILYGSITLAAIAVIIVVFVILFKYFRNPNRKHKILVHELAHEHKITETTQIPKKHIFDVTKPTNSFLTKYAPVGEKGKRKKKNAEVLPEESREIKSYSEPVPEEAVAEEPVTKVDYQANAEEIEVPVETSPAEVLADEIAEEIKAEAQPEAEEAAEQPVPEAEEKTEVQKESESKTDSETSEEPEAQTETQVEEPEQTEEMADISAAEEKEAPAAEAGEKPQKAVQSEEQFDETADYFDIVPDEDEMFSYTDVETAVNDYSKAKRGLEVNEDEDYEDIPNAWDTVKKVLAAIGRGIVAVFSAIFTVLAFVVTHLKYFLINLSRMIRRKHAQNKRRKIEEQRRRDASERRRMEREAERARRRNNQNRGSNDLVQVRSSYERGSAPRPSGRERIDRDRRSSDRRRPPQSRSSRPRR